MSTRAVPEPRTYPREMFVMWQVFQSYCQCWWPQRTCERCGDVHQCARKRRRKQRRQSAQVRGCWICPYPHHCRPRGCSMCGHQHRCRSQASPPPAVYVEGPEPEFRFAFQRHLWLLDQRRARLEAQQGRRWRSAAEG